MTKIFDSMNSIKIKLFVKASAKPSYFWINPILLKNEISKFLFLLILLCMSCSREDEYSVNINKVVEVNATTVKDKFIRSSTGAIVNELPKEFFDKIEEDLRKEGKVKDLKSLMEKYEIVGDKRVLNHKYINVSTQSTPVTFSYNAHIENTGWQRWTGLGYQVGTTGESLRLEALQFSSSHYFPLKARAHVQNKGWLPYVGLNEIVGTTGKSLRLEAIQIDIPSSFATNVYYQVHVQNIGWMPVVRNGEIAGTVGQSLRVEAFRMYMYIIR